MIDRLASLDPRALVLGIALLGLAVAAPCFVAGLRRVRQVRLGGAALYLLLGSVAVLLGAGAALTVANLVTYSRLTHEQEAARVEIRGVGERHFALSITRTGGPPELYHLHGDEWQIDARLLKWRPMGNLAGLDTVYRLERLSGRYGDIALERSAPRSVHALAEEQGLDLWSMVRRYPRYLPLADAHYGAAAYVPMAEGAEYVVSVSASGLVVRPGNEAARKALGAWK